MNPTNEELNAAKASLAEVATEQGSLQRAMQDAVLLLLQRAVSTEAQRPAQGTDATPA